MSVIRFHNVVKEYDGHAVLRDVNFRVNRGDRVGLIGKNGAGKTTVLKLALGLEEPTAGEVDVDADVKIGYFSQFSELNDDVCILEVLEDVFADVYALEAELDRIDAALAGSPLEAQLRAVLNRQAKLLDAMERCEGWSYEHKIDTVLTKLGFNEAHRTRPIAQLSGGWRNRAALAKILLEEPDVLLMDEPTNYLDVDGLAWLEQWFAKLKGSLVVVSHDRHFLDTVTNRIVEVENYHLQEYDGNFTQYVREKRLRIKSLQRQFQYEEELLVFEGGQGQVRPVSGNWTIWQASLAKAKRPSA